MEDDFTLSVVDPEQAYFSNCYYLCVLQVLKFAIGKTGFSILHFSVRDQLINRLVDVN